MRACLYGFLVLVLVSFTPPPAGAAPDGATPAPPLAASTATPQAAEMVDVLVLNTQKMTDEKIEDSDITTMSLPKIRVPKDALTKIENIVGRAARRNLQPEQPIRALDLKTFLIVKKSDMVTIELQTPSMMISAQGKALDGGGMGDTIRVLNTTSNKTIFAKITGPNLVAIQMTGVGAAR